MRDQILTVTETANIQKDIYLMKLSGDMREISAPGQFVNIRLDGFFLRRPISIADWDDESLTIVFKVVGKGTAALASCRVGQSLSVLLPLGNGFDTKAAGQAGRQPLLIGGGIGLPPIYGLAKAFTREGASPGVIAGFNTSEDVILIEEFRKLGIEPVITTVDGSCGTKGMVTDVLPDTSGLYLYTCGPEPMLRALHGRFDQGQFSFEARMACGFGACMGCSCQTKYGTKRICKDGPVLRWEEIVW